MAIARIKSLPVYLQSISEQQEIIRCVENLFAKAAVIEKKYKNLKAKIECLPQARLHTTFKGELVEQLSTDNDTQDLLNEIRGLPMAADESVTSKKSKPKLKNSVLNEIND